MEYVRVTIDPAGVSEHFIRPSARFRRSVVACTTQEVSPDLRVRRRPTGGLRFKCAECDARFRRFMQHLADVEDMRVDLFGGDYEDA